MARILIGELILRLKDEMSGKAKGAAGNVTRSMVDIERAAKRLSNAQWGVGFQRQIDKLKLNARELDSVKRSWHSLQTDLSKTDLSKALKSNQLANWRAATVGHFSAVRLEGVRLTGQMNRLKAAMKLTAGAVGLGMVGYGLPVAGRNGVIASSEQERERFRQSMAGFSEADQGKIFEASQRLSAKYRAASETEIMEMARVASSTMGGLERGLQILEPMVQGLVALKSAKGTEAGGSELSRMLRGIDNLGANAAGDLGLKQVADIIDGMVRAAQIEGQELDSGKLFDFARRAKIAGPGLSTQFISTTAPAMMQDMTPEGFGTALSSAYQAFVIGSNAVSGKANLQAQRNLGLRSGKGKGELVDADLFGTDPYQWVKAHLIPSLKKSGVNTNDETAVAKAVAQLSRNTNETGMLTRMITQQQQIDRLVEQYSKTMGTEAAGIAAEKDPFVAYEGLKSSLENLSSAVIKMPVVTSGLNSLSDAINRLAEKAKDSPAAGNAMLGAAGLAGAGGAYVAGKTAWNGFGWLAGGAGRAAMAAARLSMNPWLLGGAGLAYMLSNAKPDVGDPRFSTPEGQERTLRYQKVFGGQQFEGGRHRIAAENANGFGRESGFGFNAMVQESAAAGKQIETNLSVTASPTIDNSGLQNTLALVNQIKSALSGLGALAAQAAANADAAIRQSHSDFGGEAAP